MEDKNQHDKEPKLSLSEENEIRKLKMSAEKGAIFEGAENLPPELEKFMLDSIDDIESKINDAKQLTIFQHIGEPNLRPENELRDEQITTELEKLHRLFTDSNTSIESMKPTSERQEYKFLTEHFVKEEIKRVKNVINELISLKREWKDTIVSSEYYLKQIPEFFEKGYGPSCNAGHSFLTVTPDGYIKRCSEMPAVCHYKDFSPGFFNKTNCNTCWFGCRGETQAPILEKGKELIGL